MIQAEAGYFLAEFVPASCLSVVHVYFPDPWPKARHHKRRLVQEPFLQQVERVLIQGGRLQVVTDDQDYFEQIEPVVRASRLTIVDYSRPGSANDGEFVGTDFERKYKREGRPFHAIAARREFELSQRRLVTVSFTPVWRPATIFARLAKGDGR